MKTPAELLTRLTAHLEFLYPQAACADLAQALMQHMRLSEDTPMPAQFHNHWDAGDIWMISYGDSVRREGEPGLRGLRRFLDTHLGSSINGVHVLPFFPYTSDDGFAVSDYLAVRPDLGSWDDLRELAQDRRLMVDVVINHCSSEHPWFAQFCQDQKPGCDYFVVMDPGADLRQVVRPRTSSLLRPTPTPSGVKHVWCTFSHDQVDLNFANPQMLLELARIVRHYLDQGARVFRLDAVAFLWKAEASPSLNLPQTHEIVRLLRTLIEHADPQAVIITETNIPNRENLSYFGNANEAHVVYNFSLPPLTLHALWSGSCRYLKRWLMSMPPAQDGTTYLNFLASHDGIGLRPAEGLLSEDEILQMIATAERFGGQVSWRALEHGERKPYEINIALFDALQGTTAGPDTQGLARFICAHAIMLALEGIPAFYIHSLLGTRNDTAGMALTGQARSINRHQWDAQALDTLLDQPEAIHTQVLGALRHLIDLRKLQPAFHPNATQFTLHLNDEVFAFWRQSQNRRQSIFVLNNISQHTQHLALTQLNLVATDSWQDLISGQAFDSLTDTIELRPYQSMWISNVAPRPA